MRSIRDARSDRLMLRLHIVTVLIVGLYVCLLLTQ